jgi:hypothetical protein
MNPYLKLIHQENIYENFYILPFQTEPTNITGELNNIFGEYSGPEVTIIEVGSWKGASAIEICNFFLNKNIIPTIFCVDTFTGSTFHREHDEFFPMLNCKNGFPTLYQQFLSNIINSGLQEYVIPIPHSSHDAARYLQKLNISCDFCFVDACHEFDEVSDDIKSYWPLIKNGGTLFGDDYDINKLHWPGVFGAVDKFVNDNNLMSSSALYNTEWVIRKA